MKPGYILQVVAGIILGGFILLLAGGEVARASEQWQGVDESVVEKYAAENGRASREPLVNTDQGDLLLFVFLLAGSAGGFAAGYYWRMLVGEKTPETGRCNSE